MGNIQAKSERRAFKQLVKKNTHINQSTWPISTMQMPTDNACTTNAKLQKKASLRQLSPDCKVSFSSHIEQLEYDMESPGSGFFISLLYEEEVGENVEDWCAQQISRTRRSLATPEFNGICAR